MSAPATPQRPQPSRYACAICMESLEPSGDDAAGALAWCRHTPESCGRCIHAQCLRVWARHQSGGAEATTCPMCRAPLMGEADELFTQGSWCLAGFQRQVELQMHGLDLIFPFQIGHAITAFEDCITAVEGHATGHQLGGGMGTNVDGWVFKGAQKAGHR